MMFFFFFVPNFIAIDFEKLDDNPLSVCEMGVVKYINGEKVMEKQFFIKPATGLNRNYFGKKELSRIKDADLEKALTFDKVYQFLLDNLDDCIIVCHQKSSDMNYLYYLEKHYGLSGLTTNGYADTNEMGVKMLGVGGLKDCYKALTGESIPTKLQHHALVDAQVCASIFLEFFNKEACRHFIHHTPYVPEKEKEKKGIMTETVSIEEMDIEDNLLPSYSFEGKKVKLSGTFDKDTVTDILKGLGASVPSGDPTNNTDAFIVGDDVGPRKKELAIVQKKKRPSSFHIFTANAFLSHFGHCS